MHRRGYSSPEIELMEFKLVDTILASTPRPTEEYIIPIFSAEDELQGDGLGTLTNG